MNLYHFHADPESLKHHDTAHEHIPHVKWDQVVKKEGKAALKNYEHLWAKDARLSYEYARDVLGSRRFPAGEKVIAENPRYATLYAVDIVGGEFPVGEKAMSTDASYSYMYAEYVIHERFPAGEKAIATSAEYSYLYARNTLRKKPFPLGEKVIAENPYYAYHYAIVVLDDRFPAGEKAISTDTEYTSVYERKFKVKL